MAPSMPDRAYRLLNAFAQASNKRVLHPEDWGRFFELALMVYTHALPITGWMIRNRLLSFGFPSERADHLSAEFDRYRELLRLHDSQRTS
jgi:hypothetical protein